MEAVPTQNDVVQPIRKTHQLPLGESKLRISGQVLFAGEALDAYEVDEILEVRMEVRVTGVSFDVNETTGELTRTHKVKPLVDADVSRLASPSDWRNDG